MCRKSNMENLMKNGKCNFDFRFPHRNKNLKRGRAHIASHGHYRVLLIFMPTRACRQSFFNDEAYSGATRQPTFSLHTIVSHQVT